MGVLPADWWEHRTESRVVTAGDGELFNQPPGHKERNQRHRGRSHAAIISAGATNRYPSPLICGIYLCVISAINRHHKSLSDQKAKVKGRKSRSAREAMLAGAGGQKHGFNFWRRSLAKMEYPQKIQQKMRSWFTECTSEQLLLCLKTSNRSQAPEDYELLLHFLIFEKLAAQTDSRLFIENTAIKSDYPTPLFFLSLEFEAIVTSSKHFWIHKSNIFVMLMLKEKILK